MSDNEYMLVSGCMASKGKEVVGNLLFRRLAEIDPRGQSGAFILELHGEIDNLPTCDPGDVESDGSTMAILFGGDNTKKSAYSEFVSVCLRGNDENVKFNEGDKQPAKMKKCAERWNQMKDEK